MTEVIPAIMPDTLSDLKAGMEKVAGLAPLVQIDLMDGKFVSEKTWPYERTTPDRDFQKILKEEHGFPYWEELEFEADLMVANPEEVWRDWVKAGASRIILHIESTDNFRALLDEIKKGMVGPDSFFYSQIGVAINITTPNEELYPFVSEIDFVQFMGIERIGFQGQPFDDRVLTKISELKTRYPSAVVSVDGGVNLNSAPKLIAAGAERLVVGSAIMRADDPQTVISELQNLG